MLLKKMIDSLFSFSFIVMSRHNKNSLRYHKKVLNIFLIAARPLFLQEKRRLLVCEKGPITAVLGFTPTLRYPNGFCVCLSLWISWPPSWIPPFLFFRVGRFKHDQ